jgi:hypothetical protein
MLYGYQKKGPDDPRESSVGVMQMEGGDLMARAGEFRQKFQQTLDELENQLSTREAKAQYQRSKLSMLSSFDRHLQQRLGVQRERTVQASYDQLQDARTNNIASGATVDFESVFPRLGNGTRDMQQLDDAMFAIGITATQRGNDPSSGFLKQLDQKPFGDVTLEGQGKALSQILPILAEKDPVFANEVAKKYVDAIPDKARVFKHLEHAVFNSESQKVADLAIGVSGAPDPITGQGIGTRAEQEQKAISIIRKNELSQDQRINDEALQRIKVFFNEKNELKRQQDNELFDQLYKERLSGKFATSEELRADQRFAQISGQTQATLLRSFEKDGNQVRPEILRFLNNMAFTTDPEKQQAFENMRLDGEVVLFFEGPGGVLAKK